MAFSGKLDFDPTSDLIPTSTGSAFRFSAPEGSVLPPEEYARDLALYCPPPKERQSLVVDVDPTSDRIQLVQPFAEWDGQDEKELEMLIKVKGKCSKSPRLSGSVIVSKMTCAYSSPPILNLATDHISAAGPWYKYRGHLENISGKSGPGSATTPPTNSILVPLSCSCRESTDRCGQC